MAKKEKKRPLEYQGSEKRAGGDRRRLIDRRKGARRKGERREDWQQ